MPVLGRQVVRRAIALMAQSAAALFPAHGLMFAPFSLGKPHNDQPIPTGEVADGGAAGGGYVSKPNNRRRYAGLALPPWDDQKRP